MSTFVRARASDPQTSVAAAHRVNRGVREAMYERIEFALQHGGPATNHEIAARCVGLAYHDVARCVPELRTLGRVRDTGTTRPGPSGRQCSVWSIA